MKLIAVLLIASTLVASCASVNSNTVIKPNDSFVLGNNEHGKFKVRLQNVSANDIEVYHAPISGGKHSSQIIKPRQKATLSIDRNTALYIANTSADTANVQLKLSGDVGLSMAYKN